VDQNPFACDVGGLSTLVNCKNSDDGRTNFLAKLDGEPIRSVTLAGSFVPAPQITGGKELTLDEIDAFYTYADFNEMKSYGLNSVQIQLPVDSSLYPKNATFKMIENALNTMILRITDAKLKIILALERASVEHQDSLEDQIQTISSYAILASKKFSHDILALVLPKDFENLIPQIRNISPTLPLLLPVKSGNMKDFKNPAFADENLYLAMDMDHSTTVADIASSNIVDDRMKMYYHESMACIHRSPIDFAQCYHGLPVFVSNGFDASIDNCFLRDLDDQTFQDYGQCNNFEATTYSPWWKRHRKSFVNRQFFAFEQGLGWSFEAWKIYDDKNENNGELDQPAKLLCFQDVMTSVLEQSSIKHDDNSVQYACLNPPVADYQKGDRMFSMRATNFITSIYSSGNAFQNYYSGNPKIFGIIAFFGIFSIMAITILYFKNRHNGYIRLPDEISITSMHF